MTSPKFKSDDELTTYLHEVVKVSMDSAFRDEQLQKEKEEEARRQERLQTSIQDNPKQQQNEEEIDQEVDVPQEQPDNNPEQEVTFDSIQDRLNIIRSGKSLDDREIKDEMEKYLNGLKDSEKIALFSFLKSIGQIVAHEASGHAVKDPDEEPYDVKMKRVKGLEQNRKEKENLHRDRQNKQVSKDQKMKSDREDRSPPISVGKRVPESVYHSMKKKLII